MLGLHFQHRVLGLVEGGEAELAELRELAGRSDPTRLRRMFRALIREQEDLAWAPQPYTVLEMALVRLATMADGDDAAMVGEEGEYEEVFGSGSSEEEELGEDDYDDGGGAIDQQDAWAVITSYGLTGTSTKLKMQRPFRANFG